MSTERNIRAVRLKNDHREMLNLKRVGNTIDWKVVAGEPPMVEAYELTVQVKSVIGPEPKYRHEHRISLVLPHGYPSSPPEIRMISDPVVFHPNWFTDHRWCHNTWSHTTSLGDHVIRMIRTLQYDPEITNENSPANSRANEWYVEKKTSGLFPCDNQILPDPTVVGFAVKTNSRGFVIKNH